MSTFIPRFRPAVSLKRHSLWLLAGVVGLFAAGIALSLWVSLQSSARSDREQLELEVKHAQVGLARLKDYYRALLDNVVRAPELADLMRFGSVEAQQE